MDTHLIAHYLDIRRTPLPQLPTEASHLHNALCESAPALYLHLLADSTTHISHKREILFNLLLTNEVRSTENRQRLLHILSTMPIEQGLQVISIIQDLRINRSSARELILAYLLGHELLPELAAIKRRRLSRLFRHALGEQTWSSVRRFLTTPGTIGEQFLQRELFHYAWNGDKARAHEILCFLTGVPFNATLPALVKSVSARQDINKGEGLPQETLSGIRGIYHKQASLRSLRQLVAPIPATTLADGPLTAAYKEALATSIPAGELKEQHTSLLQLLQSLKQQITRIAGKTGQIEINNTVPVQLPEIKGRVVVILDLSGSMAASGERFNHPIALALALTHLLQTCISDLHILQTGGSSQLTEEEIQRPQGVADIALALLDAVQKQPQVILIITDGYENVRQGDTAWVAQGLRTLGYELPIYQVVPLFTSAEKLDARRLDEHIRPVPIAHENHVNELLARILLAGAGQQLTTADIQQLQQLLTMR